MGKFFGGLDADCTSEPTGRCGGQESWSVGLFARDSTVSCEMGVELTLVASPPPFPRIRLPPGICPVPKPSVNRALFEVFKMIVKCDPVVYYHANSTGKFKCLCCAYAQLISLLGRQLRAGIYARNEHGKP